MERILFLNFEIKCETISLISIQVSYCVQELKSLELMNIKKKKKNLKMGNLHFLPNNILTELFKKLKKYKNDYQ